MCTLQEAANSNIIVFGLTRPGLKPMIYRIRGVHCNHYTIQYNVCHIFCIKNIITNGTVFLSLWSLNTGINNTWLFSHKQWHQCQVYVTCVQQAIIIRPYIHPVLLHVNQAFVVYLLFKFGKFD